MTFKDKNELLVPDSDDQENSNGLSFVNKDLRRSEKRVKLIDVVMQYKRGNVVKRHRSEANLKDLLE